MTARIQSRDQLSLFDWTAPVGAVAYDPRLMLGNSFEARLSRAVSLCLDGCGRSREDVAAQMSQRLGKTISVNVLNAYASPMRDTHTISVPRLDGLLAATGDRRLLQFLADAHGWAVIDKRHEALIELAAVSEHKRAIAGREAALRRQARGGW